jgi:hypothetical protein
MDGDGEEIGGVRSAVAEVVFADLASGGEMRDVAIWLGRSTPKEPAPVCWMPEYTVKGEPELMLEMLSSSQPAVTFLPTGAEQLDAVADAGPGPRWGQRVGHIEGGWAFFGVRVEGDSGERRRRWNLTPLVSSMDLPQV